MGCTASPKFIHWSLDLQQVRMWLCLQTGPLKKQHDMVKARVGPNPVWLVSLWEEEIWTHRHQGCAITEERPSEDTARRSPSANQSQDPQKKPDLLTPWTPASRTVCPWNSPADTPGAGIRETKFCCWSHPACSISLQQLQSITVISRRI